MENLKDLVRQDLNTKKEKELQKEKEANSELKGITLYINSKGKSTLHEAYIKHLDEVEIKYTKKEIQDHPEITSTIMNGVSPVAVVNGEYLVLGRDFKAPPALVKILKLVASPKFIQIDPNIKLLESLKNTNQIISQNFQRMAQIITPIAKVMNSIGAEERKEKIPPQTLSPQNAKKNK